MAGSDMRGGGGDMLSQPAVGSELAGYRVESLIGRGGMGVVYRARDLALDRNVALKLLAPDLAVDARFRERFLRESRLAASLDHPAIVPIYDAGEVAGQLYIAMRLVEGTDLKRLLAAEAPLVPERALALLEQIADALDAAHERGLVHRDVKPSNVLLDERGHCYLADFGLSRRLTEQSAHSGPGRSLGTIDYVAPEQIRGEAVDARTDLYALGCLLYECLAGYPPYVRRSETAVVFAHLEDEPPTLPGLAAVIGKALAKEPDARFQSGRELVAAAREALKPKRPRWRRIATIVAAVLLAGGGTAAGLIATHSTRSPAPAAAKPQSLPLRANALNLIDAVTHRLISAVPSGRHRVSDIAFLDRSAWLSIPEENRLIRVDASTKRVTQVVKLPWTPTERFAVGGRLIWVREARNLGTDVLGIDGRSGRIVRRFAIGGSSIGIAYGASSLWLIGGGEVVRVDPRSGRTLHHYAANADLLTYADGALWAAGSDGSVWKIDPVGNTITAHTRLHPFVSDLAVGGGSAWVSVVGDDTIYRLSEDDLAVQQAAPAGTDPERISIGRGAVWVANTAADGLSRLTTSSGVRAALATKSEPTVMRFHDGVVWVPAAHGLPPLAPIAGEELRISTPFRFFNLDPVSRVFPMDEQLTSATCANLLGYGDTGLEPELAAAMPTISRDGRTYTFTIRPGFRFSPPSNAPVTAATVRYTIERTLSPYAHGWDYAPDIVGVAAYRAALKAGKPAHIVGIHAHGRTLSITLTRPAGDFLARLAMTVFCPVPLATPLDPSRVTGPLASDGPYYVASAERDRIVLLRNPNYAGRRSRRAARIVITDDVPTPKAVALVNSGQLDYLPQDFAGGTSLLGPSGELARASGPSSAAARAGRQRFFLHPQPMFDTIVFNSGRPLFRSASLRQAVAAAIDRAAMARAFFDAPAEHAIPGSFPGYGRAGIAAPDLRTARHLAGSERRSAVLLMPCDSSASAAAEILRGDLARIGMTVRIVRFGGCDPRDVAARFANADLMIGTSLQCGPCERDPAEIFTGLLAHGAWGSPLPPGGWNRAALEDRLEQAAPLRGPARVSAYRRLDDVAGRSAPFVVYGSYLYGEYFGARVGCLHFPSFTQGVDLGALCLRKP